MLQIDGSSSSSNGQTGGRTTQAAPPRQLLLLLLLPASQASVGWTNWQVQGSGYCTAVARTERGDWDKGRLGMGGIWGAGIGSSNNNCRDYALTQALCSLPMRVDGYVHVCVHLPAPLSVASFRLFLYVFTNGIVFNEISDANLFIWIFILGRSEMPSTTPVTSD